MHAKLLFGCLLQFGIVCVARADEPPVAFRTAPLELRPPAPAPGTAPAQPPSTATPVLPANPPALPALAPGTYSAVPYSMIVVVPAPVDQGMVIVPYGMPAARTIQPPVDLVPVPR